MDDTRSCGGGGGCCLGDSFYPQYEFVALIKHSAAPSRQVLSHKHSVDTFVAYFYLKMSKVPPHELPSLLAVLEFSEIRVFPWKPSCWSTRRVYGMGRSFQRMFEAQSPGGAAPPSG